MTQHGAYKMPFLTKKKKEILDHDTTRMYLVKYAFFKIYIKFKLGKKDQNKLG